MLFSHFSSDYDYIVPPVIYWKSSGANGSPGPSHHRKETQVFRRKNEGFSKDSAF